MSEWKEYQINDVVFDYLDFRGKTPKKLGMDWGGGSIKALSANNVEQGRINFEKECYLASELLYKIWMNKGPCAKADVVMTMEAPLGNIAQIPDNNKYILSQRTLLFKTLKHIVNNNYFFYVLSDKHFQAELIKNSTGSTVVGIQQKKLAKIKIKLPDYSTQTKIAHILSACDTVIEKTQVAISKYKAIKQGMLHDLFTRGIDMNTGKLRPKYEDTPELYKESKLGWVPRDWDVKKLEEFVTIYNGIDYKSNPPGENIPIYGTGGIMGFTSIELNEGPAVLTGRKGSINRPFYIEGKFWNVDTIFCLIPKDKNNAKWLFYNIFLTDMNKYNEATGVPSITSKTLYKLYFCHYDIPEQEKIIELITPVENKLTYEQIYLQKLQSIKQGLMGDLLSGRKRVKVEDENIS